MKIKCVPWHYSSLLNHQEKSFLLCPLPSFKNGRLITQIVPLFWLVAQWSVELIAPTHLKMPEEKYTIHCKPSVHTLHLTTSTIHMKYHCLYFQIVPPTHKYRVYCDTQSHTTGDYCISNFIPHTIPPQWSCLCPSYSILYLPSMNHLHEGIPFPASKHRIYIPTSI